MELTSNTTRFYLATAICFNCRETLPLPRIDALVIYTLEHEEPQHWSNWNGLRLYTPMAGRCLRLAADLASAAVAAGDLPLGSCLPACDMCGVPHGTPHEYVAAPAD